MLFLLPSRFHVRKNDHNESIKNPARRGDEIAWWTPTATRCRRLDKIYGKARVFFHSWRTSHFSSFLHTISVKAGFFFMEALLLLFLYFSSCRACCGLLVFCCLRHTRPTYFLLHYELFCHPREAKEIDSFDGWYVYNSRAFLVDCTKK